MLRIQKRLVVAIAATGLAVSGCSSTGPQGGPVSTQETTQATTLKAGPTDPPKGALPKSAKTRPASAASRGATAKDASKDVKLSPIRVDKKLGTPSAEVTLTNNTTKRSNYIVDLRITAPGGGTELDAAMVSAQGVPPGKTIKRTARFKTTQKLPKGATLTVVGVARLVA
jgi:hypothetical protein